MKIFNPTTMWFSTKNVPTLENEQDREKKIPELTQDDVLKTINVAPSIKDIQNKENTQEMETVNVIADKLDVIVNAVKSALGVTNEVEVEAEKSAETIEDVQTEEEIVSEETEVESQEQDEQPSNDSEEIEPSEEETVETEEGEEVVETVEEVEEEQPKEPTEQEEPVEEIAEEVQEEVVEVETEENSSVAEAIQIEAPETEVKDEEVVSEIEIEDKAELLQQIEALKAEKAEKELELQKMTLAKEVEKDFGGVPGKIEDKVDTIFEIKNSALSEETKNFILTSLKSLSVQNLSDCEEIGHDQEVVVDESAERETKIKNAMKEHGLTENQAFLFVNGDRTLAEAKKASAKVQSKRK